MVRFHRTQSQSKYRKSAKFSTDRNIWFKTLLLWFKSGKNSKNSKNSKKYQITDLYRIAFMRLSLDANHRANGAPKLDALCEHTKVCTFAHQSLLIGISLAANWALKCLMCAGSLLILIESFSQREVLVEESLTMLTSNKNPNKSFSSWFSSRYRHPPHPSIKCWFTGLLIAAMRIRITWWLVRWLAMYDVKHSSCTVYNVPSLFSQNETF